MVANSQGRVTNLINWRQRGLRKDTDCASMACSVRTVWRERTRQTGRGEWTERTEWTERMLNRVCVFRLNSSFEWTEHKGPKLAGGLPKGSKVTKNLGPLLFLRVRVSAYSFRLMSSFRSMCLICSVGSEEAAGQENVRKIHRVIR